MKVKEIRGMKETSHIKGQGNELEKKKQYAGDQNTTENPMYKKCVPTET